jgi:hypothetical protein
MIDITILHDLIKISLVPLGIPLISGTFASENLFTQLLVAGSTGDSLP